MRENSCWHCGVPLQRAAKYIGIVDVIFGGICTIIMSIHVARAYSYSYSVGYTYGDKEVKFGYSYNDRAFPREILVVLLVAAAAQAIMGVILYIGAMNKSRSICQFWLVAALLTMLFTGVLIRVWEMFIVNEFSRELREEQEVTYFTGQSPNPQAEPQPMGQQLPHYVQHTPTDKYPPHQGLGLGMVAPPPTGLGGGENIYHQPVVAAPLTNMYGVQVHGNGTQYSGQSPYNPATQVGNQQIPAALQPPPRYDALDGVGYSNGAYSSSAPKEREANGFSTSFARF